MAAKKTASSIIDDKAIKKFKDSLTTLKKEVSNFSKDAGKSFASLNKDIGSSITKVNLLTSAVTNLGKQIKMINSLNVNIGRTAGAGGGGASPPRPQTNNSPQQGSPIPAVGGIGAGGGGGGGGGGRAGGGMNTARTIEGIGDIAKLIMGLNSAGERGVASLSSLRNNVFDKVMNYDVSAVYANTKQEQILGKNKGKPVERQFDRTGQNMEEWQKSMTGAGGGTGNEETVLDKVFGKDSVLATMGKKFSETKKDKVDVMKMGFTEAFKMLGGRSVETPFSQPPQVGIPGVATMDIAKVALGADIASNIARAGGAGKVGTQAGAEMSAASLKGYSDIQEYKDQQMKLDESMNRRKALEEIYHPDLAFQQNLVNKSGMLLPAALRTGSWGKGLSAGLKSGMSSGEALQYSTGVSNQFGQGMGNAIQDFGSMGRAKFGMNAGPLAQMTGMAGIGMGAGETSNATRAKEGMDKIQKAIEAGVVSGMKDPQSFEALLNPLAQIIRAVGGDASTLRNLLLNNVSAANANPVTTEQRASGLQAMGGAMNANPYLKGRMLSRAKETLGSQGSYITTQMLGDFNRLLEGGEGFEAFGIEDQRKSLLNEAIQDLLGQVGADKSKLGDKSYRVKTAETIAGGLGGFSDPSKIASALEAFAPETKTIESINSKAQAQANLAIRGGAFGGGTKGGAAMAAEQMKTGVDLTAFTEALKSPTLAQNLSIMRKALLDMSSIDPTQLKGETGTETLKRLEALAKSIDRLATAVGQQAGVHVAKPPKEKLTSEPDDE